MKLQPPVFHEDYKGTRWTYGLDHRPLAFGHVPAGYIIGSHSMEVNPQHKQFCRFGQVDYPRELTAREVAAFELTYLYYTP